MFSYFHIFRTLSVSLGFFRNDLLRQQDFTKEYAKNLKDGINEPLKQFLENQVTKGRKLHIEMKEHDREFKHVQDQLEKSKQRFHIYAKTAEESKLHSEVAKNNGNLSNDQKNKFLNKALLTLKEAKEAEKVYIDNLNYANNYRERYVESSKIIIDQFQHMEERYIDFTRDSIRKYFEYQFILLKNLQSDYEKKVKSVETVNTNADIKDFIEKNATNLLPPYKFEFVPYTSDVQTRNYEQTLYPIGIFVLFYFRDNKQCEKFYRKNFLLRDSRN